MPCELITIRNSTDAGTLSTVTAVCSPSGQRRVRHELPPPLCYITLSFQFQNGAINWLPLPSQPLRSWAGFTAMQVLVSLYGRKRTLLGKDVPLEGDNRAVLCAGLKDDRRDTGIGEGA
jgi:hypothetical protein